MSGKSRRKPKGGAHENSYPALEAKLSTANESAWLSSRSQQHGTAQGLRTPLPVPVTVADTSSNSVSGRGVPGQEFERVP